MAAEELLRELLRDTEEKMQKALEATRRDLTTIRTGRANPAILDRVEVDYYGSRLPLTQVATVSAPEPRMLVIAPWDKGALGPIERALQKSDLGLTPNNDGNVIRLIIPQLTEERRREMTKMVHRKIEDGKVSVRNVRRDGNKAAEQGEKDGDLTEDERDKVKDDIQELTKKYEQTATDMAKKREDEVMEG